MISVKNIIVDRWAGHIFAYDKSTGKCFWYKENVDIIKNVKTIVGLVRHFNTSDNCGIYSIKKYKNIKVKNLKLQNELKLNPCFKWEKISNYYFNLFFGKLYSGHYFVCKRLHINPYLLNRITLEDRLIKDLKIYPPGYAKFVFEYVDNKNLYRVDRIQPKKRDDIYDILDQHKESVPLLPNDKISNHVKKCRYVFSNMVEVNKWLIQNKNDITFSLNKWQWMLICVYTSKGVSGKTCISALKGLNYKLLKKSIVEMNKISGIDTPSIYYPCFKDVHNLITYIGDGINISMDRNNNLDWNEIRYNDEYRYFGQNTAFSNKTLLGQLKLAHKFHEIELKNRKVLEEKKRIIEMPRNNSPDFLEPYRVKTIGEMYDLSDECHNCLRSYAKENSECLFYCKREGNSTVVAQVRCSDLGNEIGYTIEQCYDKCNKKTKQSTKFESFLKTCLSGPSRTLAFS